MKYIFEGPIGRGIGRVKGTTEDSEGPRIGELEATTGSGPEGARRGQDMGAQSTKGSVLGSD